MIRPDFTGDVPFSIWSMARFEGDAEGAGPGSDSTADFAGLFGGAATNGMFGGSSSSSASGSVGGSVGSSSSGGKGGSASGSVSGGFGGKGGPSSSSPAGGAAAASGMQGFGGSASAGGSVGGGNFGGSGNDFGGLFGGAATNGMFGGGSASGSVGTGGIGGSGAGNSAGGSVGGSLGGPGSAVGSGLGALSGISSIGAGLYSGIGQTTPFGFSMPNSISTPYSSIGKYAPSARAAEDQSMAAYNAFSTSARAAEEQSMDALADARMNAYLDAMFAVESNNNPNAKAKTSSAAGLAQFTSKTFLSLVEQTKPAWAKNLTKQEILDKRFDPVIARSMALALTKQNQAILSKNNVQVTPATTYLAHFIGPVTASKIAKADPNTPVSNFVSQKAINANRSVLAGKTTGQVMGWAADKMAAHIDVSGVMSTTGKNAPSTSKSSQVAGGSISPATVGHMAAMGGNTSPQGTKSASASAGLTTATPASSMPSSITGATNASHRAAEDISMAAYNSIPDEAKSYLSKWGPGPDATVAGYDISNNASTISAPSQAESHFADTYLGGNDEGKTGVAADDSADEAPATTAEATPSQTAETGKTDEAGKAGKTDTAKSQDESKPSIGKQIAGTVIDISLGMIPGVGMAATGFNVLSAISGKPSIGQTIAGGLFNGSGNYTGQPATDFGHGDGGSSVYIPSTLSDSQFGSNDNGYVDFVTKYIEFDDGIDRPTPADKWDRNRRKYGRLAYG